jgi:hypothetical protein
MQARNRVSRAMALILYMMIQVKRIGALLNKKKQGKDADNISWRHLVDDRHSRLPYVAIFRINYRFKIRSFSAFRQSGNQYMSGFASKFCRYCNGVLLGQEDQFMMT